MNSSTRFLLAISRRNKMSEEAYYYYVNESDILWTEAKLLLLCNSSTRFWAVVLISSCLIYFASYDGNCQQKCKHFICLPLCLGLITRQLRRMYGLRAVFLECCQPVRPLNWLSSLYGLTVKKESIIFDIMEQKSWRSV